MRDFGLVKGDECGRDGCKGIINEHEKDGSCSCHINPPCSYCTTDTAYCPVCNWSCDDEVPDKVDPELQKKQQEYWAEETRKRQDARDSFIRKFNGIDPIEKYECWPEGHTHFSMKKKGVFPANTETRTSVEEKEKGTFGGRFELFNESKGCFIYIAYTD